MTNEEKIEKKKEYYKKNKEIIREKQKIYYLNNKLKYYTMRKKWRDENKDKCLGYVRNFRARQKLEKENAGGHNNQI